MKSLFIVTISLFLLSVRPQDCNNPLLDVFNLPALNESQSGSDLAFCSNLQNGQTCCSAETVLTFQSRLENLTTSLQNLAGERDVYMTELYSNYTHQYQRIADDLSDFDDDVRALKRENVILGSAVQAQFSFLLWLDDKLDRIDDNFTRAFRDYQDKRQTCFQTLLQIQASAWCLACDPNYASSGVNEDGTINASPDVCNAIQRDCTPFLLGGNYLNPLFQAQQAYRRLQNLTDYLRAYRNGNAIPSTVLEDEPWDAFPFQRTSSVPSNCNSSSCEWQCSNLFSPQYELNSTIAANGAGEIGGKDVSFSNIPFVVPLSQAQKRLRLLQDISQWSPDLDSTGLTYNVVADPSNVRDLLPPNDNTDDDDDYITDETDGTDEFTDEYNWSDKTDNDQTDDWENDPTDRTDNDPTDRTDNDDTDDNSRNLQRRNRRSDSSDDTDTDSTDSDSDK